MGHSKLLRSNKILKVQLTNEIDPFFLYSLEVGEEDFQNLKVEQCILVDFSTFPYKFIELLEYCIDSGNHGNPRFQAILYLRSGDSTFSIVEANQFKHLSHLSLCFRQGNDSMIKSYLAGRLAEFKASSTDLHEKLRRTLVSLEKALRDNNNLSSEVDELRENNSQTVSRLKTEYALDIAREKEKALQEQSEMKGRLEKERSDLENHFRQQFEAEQERTSALQKQIHSLLDDKYLLDLKLAELGAKLTSFERELNDKAQECDNLRVENQNLKSEKNDCNKILNCHLIRLSAFEQEVQDKNEMIANLSKQLEEQSSQRASLQLSLKDSQAALARAEEKESSAAAEVNKCNQLIEKLQADFRSCKAKLKLKEQVTAQQEILISERQAMIDKALLDNNGLKLEISGLKDDNESLKKQVDASRIKLDEAQELQKSNQQMIQWLNQQLTDAQLGKIGSTSLSSRYLFRPRLSFLSNPDCTFQGTTNHLGSSVPSAASSNGAFASTSYKSIGASSSEFGQPFLPRSAGFFQNNGISHDVVTLSSKSNIATMLGGGRTSTINPAIKLQLKSQELAKSDSKSCEGEKTRYASAVLERNECASKQDNSNPSIQKQNEVPWTILPRPLPLSFEEARSELMNQSGNIRGYAETKLSNDNEISEARSSPSIIEAR